MLLSTSQLQIFKLCEERMKKRTTIFGLTAAGLALVLSAPSAFGQGCIVARSTVQPMGPESGGGYMEPGQFDFTLGFRHQFSFRHFVGDVEQKQRIQLGTQVMNKINLQDYNLTYGLTSRWSLNVDLPLLLASRRSNNAAFTTTAQGIGDIVVTAQTWLWSPAKAHKGNVQLGFGFLAPTGKPDVQNSVDRFDGKGAQNTLVDYSIQPGSGGWGAVLRWSAFRTVGAS